MAESEVDTLMLKQSPLLAICSIGLLASCSVALSSMYGPLPPSYFLLIPAFIIGYGAIGVPLVFYLAFTWIGLHFRMSRSDIRLAVPLPSWFFFLFIAAFSGHFQFFGPLTRFQYVSDAMTTWWTVAYVMIGLLITSALAIATLRPTRRAEFTIVANALIVLWLFTYAFAYGGEMP